jgi:hypothetical protein
VCEMTKDERRKREKKKKEKSRIAAQNKKNLGESPKKNSRHKHAQAKFSTSRATALSTPRIPSRSILARTIALFFFLLLKAAAAHNTQSVARIGEHDRERERENFLQENLSERDSLAIEIDA